MKKLLILAFSAVLAISMVSCAKNNTPASSQNTISEDISSENTGFAGLPNPVKDYESLREVNELVGCDLVHPPVMGVSDEQFCVIGDVLGQYKLSVNGIEYTFRACKTEDDITGMYVNDGTLMDGLKDTEDGTAVNYCGYNVARWFVGEMQYTLTAEDADGSMIESFQTFVDEAMTLQG